MITRNMLRAVALATTCLAPLAAYADDFSVEATPADNAAAAPAAPVITIGGLQVTGAVGFGIMGVGDGNNNLAGRYNGLNTSGAYFGITDLDLKARSAWDSGQGQYYELQGDNLMFQPGTRNGSGVSSGTNGAFASSVSNGVVNSGDLHLKVGDAGVWSAGVSYDSITYTGNVIDSIYSMDGTQGVLNSPLLKWGGATPTAKGTYTTTTLGAGAYTAAQLNAAEAPVLVGTRRDIVAGDFKYIWNDWTFTGAIRHEHKEGSMEESLDESGAYGGTTFAMPVDYDTDRYDVSASYSTRSFQSIFQYTFSHFVDNNLFVNMPYPTSNTAPTGSSPTPGPYQRSAAYSLPPSNDAHYVTILLADNDIIPKTRLNFNARVGIEKQNDNFAPNSADPGGANLTGANVSAANLVGLNSSLVQSGMPSPDLMATVYQIKVSANSNPFPNIDTRIFYDIDARNMNKSSIPVYVGGGGGSSADTTPGGASSSSLLTAVPQDWLKENAGAEVGYMILPDSETKLSAGYQLNRTDRSNAQVGHSATESGSLALSSSIGDDIDGKISLDVSDRTGNLTYLGPWAYIGQGASYSGAYYQAPMTSEGVTARADYSPATAFSGGFFVQFRNENYSYPSDNGGTLAGSGQGVKQDFALEIGPDFTYRPSKTFNFHAFYNYELLFYNFTGNGGCATSNTGLCAGSVGYFQNKDTTGTHTIGFSAEWQANDKLKLKGEYTFSYGTVMFGEFDGVFVANPTTSAQNVANYPDINTTMNSLKFTATYQLRPNIELIGQAIYLQMSNNDWNDTANAVQTYGATNTSVLLTPGYNSPNYSIVAALGGVRVKF